MRVPDISDAPPTEPPTAEEVAESALAWLWESHQYQVSNDEWFDNTGEAFMAICRRLGGRFLAEVEELEAVLREAEIERLAWLADMKKRIKRDPEIAKDQRLFDQLRPAILERDNYTCLRCEAKKKLCVDHIIPRSAGGLSTYDNLQTLCKSCNSSKGFKTGPEWDFRQSEAA